MDLGARPITDPGCPAEARRTGVGSSHFCFHSSASHCASAICPLVILLATALRLLMARVRSLTSDSGKCDAAR